MARHAQPAPVVGAPDLMPQTLRPPPGHHSRAPAPLVLKAELPADLPLMTKICLDSGAVSGDAPSFIDAPSSDSIRHKFARNGCEMEPQMDRMPAPRKGQV